MRSAFNANGMFMMCLDEWVVVISNAGSIHHLKGSGMYPFSSQKSVYSTFGQLVFTMKPLKSSFLSMTLSHDDRHLAAGAQDGTVMMVDIVSGEVLATLKEQGPITAVALTQLER